MADFDPGGGRYEGVTSLLQAVVQSVLMFWAEMWFLTTRMERALSRFQNKFAQQLIRMQKRRRGGWELGLFSDGSGNGGIGL